MYSNHSFSDLFDSLHENEKTKEIFNKLINGISIISYEGEVTYKHGIFETVPSNDIKQIKETFNDASCIDKEKIIIPSNNDDTTAENKIIFYHSSLPIKKNTSWVINGRKYQLIFVTYSTIHGISHGRKYGMIAEKVSFGFILFTFKWPNMIQTVSPIVDKVCSKIRV